MNIDYNEELIAAYEYLLDNILGYPDVMIRLREEILVHKNILTSQEIQDIYDEETSCSPS